MQSLSADVRPPVPYVTEWLQVDGRELSGFACLTSIRQSPAVHESADGPVYVRRNASSVKVDAGRGRELGPAEGAETYVNQELADYTPPTGQAKLNARWRLRRTSQSLAAR